MTGYEIPITTGLELPGRTVRQNLGITFGLVVRSMGIAKNFTAGFKALRQGEVVENAKLLGANGIVSMRFDSSEMGQQLTEVVAYGTAVVLDGE